MIVLRDVEVRYAAGPAETRLGLRVEHLEIARGSWVQVVGPNGSGKTTLLRVLAGELRPSRGEVLLHGLSLSSAPPAERARLVALLDQDPARALVPTMTIAENLALFAFVPPRRRWSHVLAFLAPALDRETRRRATEVVSRLGLGLEDRTDDAVALLSGGERQGVALAGLLLRRPRVLLLDEAFAALDARIAPRLLRLVREAAARENLTVVNVTHDLDALDDVGDRLLVLQDGHVVLDVSRHEARSFTRTAISRLSRPANATASTPAGQDQPGDLQP